MTEPPSIRKINQTLLEEDQINSIKHRPVAKKRSDPLASIRERGVRKKNEQKTFDNHLSS